MHTLQKVFREAGGHWSTFVIWAKNTFTMGRSDYQRQYEPILYGWKEGTDHFWCGARDQGDVWFIKKPHVNDLHPTMKPVELVERAIRNSSKGRDTVLDPFGGSGTTLIACEKAGRQARLIELEPKYCDVIIRRWQEFSGKEATLDGDGRSVRRRGGRAARRGGVNRTLPPGDCGQSEQRTAERQPGLIGACAWRCRTGRRSCEFLKDVPWKIKFFNILIPATGLISGLIGAYVGLQNRALLAEVRKELAELENRIITRINGTYVRAGGMSACARNLFTNGSTALVEEIEEQKRRR